MLNKRSLFVVLAFTLLVLSLVRFNIPTVKAQGTITQTFTSQTYDGYIHYSGENYEGVRNNPIGTVDDDKNFGHIGQTYSAVLLQYSVKRVFVFFDTSSIPDDANITEAKLSLYNYSDCSDTDFNLTVQNGQPYYPHKPLESGDYYYDHYSGDGGQFNTSDLAAGYNNITLNSDGKNWIQTDETTKLCLRSNRDINLDTPTGNEYAAFYMTEKGSSYAPKLYVSYEAFQYGFHGLFDENSGLWKSPGERAVNVTAYYTDETTETFEVNGTYTFNTTLIPLYFHVELGSNDREYWLCEEEVNINIYLFNASLTSYTVSFLDLAGVLDDNPIVEAQRYINGTLMTVEKRKVDAENKLEFSLVQGCKYTIIIEDGSSYTFGDLLMTSQTTIQLTLKGVAFSKETLLTYKYVRIYGSREFGTTSGWTTPSNIHSKCGETAPNLDVNAVDGDNATYWRHEADCYHWIIFDMISTRQFSKARVFQSDTAYQRFGLSDGVTVYVGDDPADFGAAVWEGVLNASGWQETGAFDKEGRYVKIASKSSNDFQRLLEFNVYGELDGTITITYQDTLNMTASVKIYIKYKDGTTVYTATETTDSFNHEWSSASNDVDYKVTCVIDHGRYGVYSWKQYFPKQGGGSMPWGLDWFGKSLPFNTAYIIPALLILFVGGCFSMINPEVGAFLMVVTAIVIAYMGWLPIPEAALVTALAFAVIMGIIAMKRKVQT